MSVIEQRFGLNEYGTPISYHHCPVCGIDNTCCPPSDEPYESPCALPFCASYDPSRDVDRMLSDGAEIRFEERHNSIE